VNSIDWSKWHVFWVDERVVPKDHPDSNYKLAYDNFLSKVSDSLRAYTFLFSFKCVSCSPDGVVLYLTVTSCLVLLCYSGFLIVTLERLIIASDVVNSC